MLVLIVRTIILYCGVVFSVRLMGKRQIGELQPSELVTAIMISDLASVPMQSIDIPLLSGILPVLTLVVLEVSLSFILQHSKIARRVLCGEPSILVYNGEINIPELVRLRFSVSDLVEELRANNFHNIDDVETAILETNGKLSVIAKSTSRTVTTADMNITHPKADGLPYTVITDGKVNKNEMKRANIDMSALNKLLKKNNIDDISKVVIASIDVNDKLIIQKYKK